jgi:hypothetical protein
VTFSDNARVAARRGRARGPCYCGQISFEAEIEPGKVRVCHCTDCQTLSGSAFRTNVPVLQGTFVLKKGAPKIFLKTADNLEGRADRSRVALPGSRGK